MSSGSSWSFSPSSLSWLDFLDFIVTNAWFISFSSWSLSGFLSESWLSLSSSLSSSKPLNSSWSLPSPSFSSLFRRNLSFLSWGSISLEGWSSVCISSSSFLLISLKDRPLLSSSSNLLGSLSGRGLSNLESLLSILLNLDPLNSLSNLSFCFMSSMSLIFISGIVSTLRLSSSDASSFSGSYGFLCSCNEYLIRGSSTASLSLSPNMSSPLSFRSRFFMILSNAFWRIILASRSECFEKFDNKSLTELFIESSPLFSSSFGGSLYLFSNTTRIKE